MSIDEIARRLDVLEAKVDSIIDIVRDRPIDEERRRTMDAMLELLQDRELAAQAGGAADLPYTKEEAEELYTEAAARALESEAKQ